MLPLRAFLNWKSDNEHVVKKRAQDDPYLVILVVRG